MRCLLVTAAMATTSPAAAAKDDFLAARDAFRAGDARKLDFCASRLQNYILEPYVAYWQLRLRLEEATAPEIRRFLATYADTPLANRLLADWLRVLGKNQQWDLFDADYAVYGGEDLDIACYAIQSKSRTRAEAVYEARPLWFVPKELPDNCNPLINVLVQNQRISQEDVWTRVRIALEGGQVADGAARRLICPPDSSRTPGR